MAERSRRLRELAACALYELEQRRERRQTPLGAALDSYATTMAAVMGRPPIPEPEPLHCPSCRHANWRHTDVPGAGCKVRDCLCLTPLSVVLDA